MLQSNFISLAVSYPVRNFQRISFMTVDYFHRYLYPSVHYNDPMTPYSVINSSRVLTFHAIDLENKVWHWCDESRVKILQDATAFRLESEIRIRGKADEEAGTNFKKTICFKMNRMLIR